MSEAGVIEAIMRREGMPAWADRIEQQLVGFWNDARHGDWGRWRAALQQLPLLGPGQVDVDGGCLTLRPAHPLEPDARQALIEALQLLRPWRKGPYRIDDVMIDTEWRSDWKWDRVRPHLAPLEGRLVLDVGCGNGYHCWRMVEAGARQVFGIDPTALFMAQFLAIRSMLEPMAPRLAERLSFLPLGMEAVPSGLRVFDTVFSMGILYHRRSPLDHLIALRDALREGGQLVLETLVIEGDVDRLLLPRGRYAKMRNVWFIPSSAMLERWLERCGFRAVKTVDINTTSIAEQRATDWMRFESLADFLDPADNRLTIEGYPAPRRAILIAEA